MSDAKWCVSYSVYVINDKYMFNVAFLAWSWQSARMRTKIRTRRQMTERVDEFWKNFHSPHHNHVLIKYPSTVRQSELNAKISIRCYSHRCQRRRGADASYKPKHLNIHILEDRQQTIHGEIFVREKWNVKNWKIHCRNGVTWHFSRFYWNRIRFHVHAWSASLLRHSSTCLFQKCL